VTFADGKEKTVESVQKLRPGIDSEPIKLGATGAITSVKLTFNAKNWAASTRAPVTVYGS
jgi:putative lipoic acid-binding regulatory protein